MDNLQKTLVQMLNDPDRVKQIMSIAEQVLPQTTASEEQSQNLPSAEMIMQLQSIVQQAGKTDEKEAALIQALCPYLKPGRQQRLQRAIQIAHLSRAAGAAFRSGSFSFAQGGDHSV